jgi:hypothetical protein
MRVVCGGVNDLKQGGFLSWMLFVHQCSFLVVLLYIKILQNIHVPTFFTGIIKNLLKRDRPPLLAFPYFPSGRRDLGRPKQRWKDQERLIERKP